ncbi:MAG TPA: 2-oxo-4-hydroxy-4-carboxy-5-ureidoimidazoline decarboxylase [Candidatus Limnocylindrales bacterium]|nr:2-oxo-4-hydroxy-4-carboxy-5-ureidoimidazoline decarboxylase [Candidatus Limnocylindrales bacterium]
MTRSSPPPATAGVPPVEVLDTLDADICAAALAPLFEGAPRFLARLCAARPFGGEEQLFARARQIALAMPQSEQHELLDAHPRLGAPPGSVSALSFREQGYDREAAGAAAEAERQTVQQELDRLNAAYERRFGFRYCTFVAGRTRAALLPEFRQRLEGHPDDERRRGLEAVVDIARDRYQRSRRAQEGT